MSRSKFSIVVCTLNSGKYLRECLQSIECQDFKEFEVVVVDGGSTDDTLDIISQFNLNIRILHNVRGGVAAAMNEGIKNSCGEIISILHSDDYYFRESTLRTVYCYFSENSNLWLYGNIFRDLKGAKFQNSIEGYSLKRLLHTFDIPHPAVFVRREVYTRIGLFDCKYKYAMDYDFILRAAKIYKPFQTFDILTCFREHEFSLSTANRALARLEVLKIQLSGSKNLILNTLALYRWLKTELKERII